MHDIGANIIFWAAVAAAGVGLLEMARRALRRARRAWRAAKQWLVNEIAKPVQETRAQTATVAAEVTHNGGSSMKDAVGRTEDAIRELRGEVRTQAARLDDHLRIPHIHER